MCSLYFGLCSVISIRLAGFMSFIQSFFKVLLYMFVMSFSILCILYTTWENTWIILGMCLANERRRYYVTSSLIGKAHTHNVSWNTGSLLFHKSINQHIYIFFYIYIYILYICNIYIIYIYTIWVCPCDIQHNAAACLQPDAVIYSDGNDIWQDDMAWLWPDGTINVHFVAERRAHLSKSTRPLFHKWMSWFVLLV